MKSPGIRSVLENFDFDYSAPITHFHVAIVTKDAIYKELGEVSGNRFTQEMKIAFKGNVHKIIVTDLQCKVHPGTRFLSPIILEVV